MICCCWNYRVISNASICRFQDSVFTLCRLLSVSQAPLMHIPTLTRHPHADQQLFCRFLCPNCTAIYTRTRTYTHSNIKGGEAAGGVILRHTCDAFKLSFHDDGHTIGNQSVERSTCLILFVKWQKIKNNNNNSTRTRTLAFPDAAFMQQFPRLHQNKTSGAWTQHSC